MCDVVLIIYLDFIAGFKMIFFPKVSLLPHDDLDPTLSCDDTFIWIFELPQILLLIWLKFYVLVARSVLAALFLCLQNLLVFKHVIHWGASVHFLTEISDIIYWLLIILSFLNLKCLRPLFIMLAFYVSFMGVSYFWNLFLMTMCWRISVSRYWADFTFFWWKFLAVLKTLVWCLLLRSGLNIFLLPARNEITHCFGFWFLISFLKCNLLTFEVFSFFYFYYFAF